VSWIRFAFWIIGKLAAIFKHEKTMEFVQMVERCGVSALAVHGRRRDERPAHKCRLEEIREICRAITSIPVIANGGSREIKRYEDIEHFREQTGASSVMVARKAFTNPSIFRQEGMLGMDEEIQNFLAKVTV
jgi:tRNA-dihydrouridine synthase 2